MEQGPRKFDRAAYAAAVVALIGIFVVLPGADAQSGKDGSDTELSATARSVGDEIVVSVRGNVDIRGGGQDTTTGVSSTGGTTSGTSSSSSTSSTGTSSSGTTSTSTGGTSTGSDTSTSTSTSTSTTSTSTSTGGTTTTGGAAELTVTKTGEANATGPDETYTVTVTNDGDAPSDADTVVTDNYGPGLTFKELAAGTTGVTCGDPMESPAGPGTIDCTIADPIAPGASKVFMITMNVEGPDGPRFNCAQLDVASPSCVGDPSGAQSSRSASARRGTARSAQLSCGGRIAITLKARRRTIRRRVVKLGSECGFSKTIRVKKARIPRRLRNVRRLKVITQFSGNATLRPSRDVETVRIRRARRRAR